MTDTPQYQITFADALTKLDWGTARWEKDFPDESKNIQILALKNEVCGFQVLARAAADFVFITDGANWLHPLGFCPRLRLEVSLEDFPQVAGQQAALEVFPIGYIEGDDRRYWMETLERGGYANAPGGRTQGAYVRIRVPKEAPAGIYRGKVRALAQYGFEDESVVWEGEYQLAVADAALPDVKDYAFHLNLWQHLTAIARYHRVALWGAKHFRLIERYYASLAQLGQKVVSIIATEIPWSGQRCYRDQAYPSYLFEHAVIGVERTGDGKLLLHFDVLDRLLALAKKYHMDQQIDVFGLVNIWVDEEYGFGKVAEDAPDAVRVRCYDTAAGRWIYLRRAEELHAFIRGLHDHFLELGVMDRVRVAADEPADLEAFNRSVAFVHEAGPEFQYSAAINHFEFLDDAPAQVIDFIPVLPLACKDPALTARLTQTLHARGGKMHWYVCCWPPIPNTFLRSPLAEARLHGWLTHALGLDGFLRWAFCLWPADPWERVSWRAPGWSAGDMYFVLPGNDGAPVETLRYEALRMAVQDYELLRLVESRLPKARAEAVIQQAMGCVLHSQNMEGFANPDPAKASELYSLDPADYLAARRILITALE